jgi:hypothetical protein
MAKQKPDSRRDKQADQKASRKPSKQKETSSDFNLDLFARGPLREIVERFRTRLLEEAGKIAANRKINANDLELAYQRILSTENSEDWSVANRRRIFLIHKQVAGEISTGELLELESLQAMADRHMSMVAPRPLEALWELKRKLESK